MLKSATVVANPKKGWAEATMSEVKSYLSTKGVRVSDSGEILIAIGGDGTILYNKPHYNKPIFGIGSHTSSLCQARHDNWKQILPKLLSGYKVEKRLMLSSKLDGIALPEALNEVAIRNRAHRILVLMVKIGSKPHVFSADGILFSTSTGSTAYCYSAGGKIMTPASRKYQAVAIAPYKREFSPSMIDEKTKSMVEVESECDADVIIDGQFVFPMRKKSVVEVWASPDSALFVKA
jgi:NAD+ kinase